jgi:hypothetical protein
LDPSINKKEEKKEAEREGGREKEENTRRKGAGTPVSPPWETGEVFWRNTLSQQGHLRMGFAGSGVPVTDVFKQQNLWGSCLRQVP